MRYVVLQIKDKEYPVCFSATIPDDAVIGMVNGAAGSEGKVIAAGTVQFHTGAVTCEGFDNQFNVGSRGRHDEIIIQSADFL